MSVKLVSSRKGEDVAAAGNDQVVETLEAYLREARRGRINYIAIVACVMPEEHGIGIAGDSGMGRIAKRGLAEISDAIDARELNGAMPERDEALGEDYVTYNLAACPVSFDFLYWLIESEMGRRRAGAPAPLKVSFWSGRDGVGRINEPNIRLMYENVLRPLVKMIGGIEVEPSLIGRCRNIYITKFIADHCRKGEDVPLLCAPPAAAMTVAAWLGDRQPPVTITLREAKHWPHRNSNMKAWLKFARYLQARGERVIFVRDTQRALERMDGFATYPPASTDLLLRAALYGAAKANLFVANGPGAMAMFMGRPMLSFTKLEPDGHAYFPNTPAFWREQMGIREGEQFPWMRPDQRIIWDVDTYENLVAAWEQHIGCVASPVSAGLASAP